jgi:hypothetical protein
MCIDDAFPRGIIGSCLAFELMGRSCHTNSLSTPKSLSELYPPSWL